ncbi:uncharacterized protein LOC128549078 [Mercenaria mercenaria]|uniref:uncharacterized protein LOC128549078 n=1 Tax=Mercenaria mercenaria TaxID=6596 RepID=UPI00234F70E1|nr:uncharacterized protein LOC128549078 [Mercenaria mercenaria]
MRARSESQIKHELANGHYKIVHEKPHIVSALGAIPKKDSNKITGGQEAELDRAVQFYTGCAFADSTKRAYKTHRKSYLDFCSKSGYAPVPATSFLPLCSLSIMLHIRWSKVIQFKSRTFDLPMPRLKSN